MFDLIKGVLTAIAAVIFIRLGIEIVFAMSGVF